MITLKEIFEQLLEAQLPKREIMASLIGAGKIEFTRHADEEMRKDNISRQDAIDALTKSQGELTKTGQFGETRYCFKKGKFRIVAVAPALPHDPPRIVVLSGYDITKKDPNQGYRPSFDRGKGIAGPRPTGYKP